MASYASGQSTAIDYQRFAPQQEEKPPIEVLPPSKKAKRVQKATTPYLSYIIILGCVFAVLAIIITGNMYMTQLMAENTKLSKEISTLKGEAAALNVKKEQLYPLSFVENYAKTVLGMVKLDKQEIVYVELSNPEKITITNSHSQGSRLFIALTNGFDSLMEYLR